MSPRPKPVQWMTLNELRTEADRTRAAWEGEHVDVGAFLETGKLPEMSTAARRHQDVIDELSRRASVERAPAGPEDEPVNPDTPTNSA